MRSATNRPTDRTRQPMVEALEERLNLTALPSGFSETLVAGKLGSPTAMDVLGDGRVLITTQNGDLRVVKNGALLATPFLRLTVDSGGERGLLGVAHDPNFAANGFVYVYHTVPATGSAAPFNEVTRYTAAGDTAAADSAVDILKLNDLSGATNHNGGAMHFGADGKLYIDVGENANAANSQTLGNLLGKVLRIDVSNVRPGDPLNNTAKLVPGDNPFVGKATGINQAIFALGFRNPFTFAVRPSTGAIYVNDVGQGTWEEIDKLVAGGNYGWNKSEGFAGPNPPGNLGPGAYQDPLLAYNHSGGPAGGGIAIVGGAFYDAPAGAANPFPASYNGKYFYGDLGGNWIRVFDPAKPGTVSTPDPSASFASGTVGNPVGLTLAPDGGLYYLARGSGGELLKISAAPAAAKPTITQQPAARTVSVGGSAAFTVAASGAGTLGYQWQRNSGAGGAFANVAGATSAAFTLNNAQAGDGGAQFRVVVSNAGGSVTSNAAALTVTSNQAPAPVITLIGGLRNGKFDAGTPVAFSFSASDPEDGAEPAGRYSYHVDYVTSLNGTPGGVVRPFVAATAGQTGGSFTPAASGPYTLTDVLYRVTLKVTDAGGLSTTVTKDLAPNVSTITLATTPAALSLNVDGQTKTAPTSFAGVVGFTCLLDAPASQNAGGKSYAFASWSDRGAASHDVTTPAADATYTAAYTAVPAAVRLEAESLKLQTYTVESGSSASGGKFIGLKAGKPGTASGTFTGLAGTYLLKAGYYDETDGIATLTVALGGKTAASFKLNQSLGSTVAEGKTHASRSLGVFALTAGEAVVLGGTPDGGEYARWDYLEFVPQSAPQGTPAKALAVPTAYAGPVGVPVVGPSAPSAAVVARSSRSLFSADPIDDGIFK